MGTPVGLATLPSLILIQRVFPVMGSITFFCPLAFIAPGGSGVLATCCVVCFVGNLPIGTPIGVEALGLLLQRPPGPPLVRVLDVPRKDFPNHERLLIQNLP
jgi:hypothetical protein